MTHGLQVEPKKETRRKKKNKENINMKTRKLHWQPEGLEGTELGRRGAVVLGST